MTNLGDSSSQSEETSFKDILSQKNLICLLKQMGALMVKVEENLVFITYFKTITNQLVSKAIINDFPVLF